MALLPVLACMRAREARDAGYGVVAALFFGASALVFRA